MNECLAPNNQLIHTESKMVLENYGEIPVEYLLVPEAKTTASVIFLHGAEWTGKRQKEHFIKLLGDNAYIPHIKFIFPTSPTRFFELVNKETTCWFKTTQARQVNSEDFTNSMKYIEQIYKEEVDKGTAPSRIVIGGISQGGCIALSLGYTRLTEVRGVAVISSTLLLSSEELIAAQFPELYHIQWSEDPIMNTKNAKSGFELLKSKNVKGIFSIYDGIGHDMSKEQLQELYAFIARVLPRQ